MSMQEPSVCSLWDLTPPAPAPHSRLYHLEPIGVGTMYVESLTSYVTRLAQAHALPVRELAIHEIAPLLDQHYAPEIVRLMFSRESRVLNGIGPWTAKAVFALEKLTGRNELSFLTMWVFSPVLSKGGLLRSAQAWCPMCYHEWRQAGQRVYNPLLWALRAITVCPHHRQPLHVRCPHPACQASVPFLASRGETGYCPECQGWLGSALPKQGEASLNEEELQQAVWKANASGELLAAGPYLTSPPSKERVAEAMLAYVESRPGESALGIAFRAGLPQNRLQSYLRNTNTLRFDLLLDTCWRLGLSPVHTLIDPETINQNRQSDIDWLQELRAEFDEQSEPPDIVEIQRILTTTLTSDETPPPSLGDVARRVKRSPDTLRHHFPESCRVIAERQQAYHQAEKLRAQRELEAILDSGKAPLPALGEIAQQIDQPKDFLRRHFPELCCAITERRRAYDEAEELRTRRELEAVVKADDDPPPTVCEIAQQLGQSESFLYRHFPELCRTLTERRRAYDEAEELRTRRELEAILNADESPPPTLGEVAQRLEQSEGFLRRRYPELCHTLAERRCAYDETQKLCAMRRLEAVLNADQDPPPSLRKIAQQLGRPDSFLRRNFPELCRLIVEQRLAYRESEKSRLQRALETSLANAEKSPPSLSEVAQQLGQPVWRLWYLFPDLCRAITTQQVRHDQDCVLDQAEAIDRISRPDAAARALQWQQQLEIILISDEAPPPSLREVARRLENDSATLEHYCPDLCQAIMQRRTAYQEAEKLTLQRELEAILASSETPPPSLREVARRLESSDTTLRGYFPDLCQATVQRRKAYQEAEELRIRHELEVILASDEAPPLSWPEVARQLEQPESRLCYHFPGLYQAIVERHQAYRQTEKLTLQRKLEAALTEGKEPAPSLKEIARRFGHSTDRLRRLFPELCQRISARYLADEKARAAQKMEQLQIEIRQATIEIWQGGLYPSRSRVSSRLSKPGYFRSPELDAAWRKALQELGLSD
jgi:AraC-like DNA-binding protein